MIIKISEQNGKIYCKTPFEPSFPYEARRLDGKWDVRNEVWIFHKTEEEEVRQLCKDIFGTDGSDDAKFVSIRYEYDGNDTYINGLTLSIGGRVVARCWGRDSGAKKGERVVIKHGGFDSGGSMKHPHLIVQKDTVVIIHDIVESIALKLAAMDPAITIEGVTSANIADLREERLRLLNRVAEIDKIIAMQTDEPANDQEPNPELIDAD
jgi:hypothetical protein